MANTPEALRKLASDFTNLDQSLAEPDASIDAGAKGYRTAADMQLGRIVIRSAVKSLAKDHVNVINTLLALLGKDKDINWLTRKSRITKSLNRVKE